MDIQAMVEAAGSGAVIETVIENVLKGYVPTRLKPLAPVAAGIGMGFVIGAAQGYTPAQCVALGLISAGTAIAKNDSGLTSAVTEPVKSTPGA